MCTRPSTRSFSFPGMGNLTKAPKSTTRLLSGNSVADLGGRKWRQRSFSLRAAFFADNELFIDAIGVENANIEFLPDEPLEEFENFVLVAVFDARVVSAAKLRNGGNPGTPFTSGS